MPRRHSDGLGIRLWVDQGDYMRVRRLLDGLGPRVEKKVSRRAVRAAVRPILAAGKANARAYGWSRDYVRACGVRMRTYSRTGTVFAVIGPRTGGAVMRTSDLTGEPRRYDPGRIAHLLEYGTAPHTGRLPGGHRYRHPGTPPRPAWRRAYDGARHDAVRTYAREIWTGARREAAKLGGR